MTSLFERALGDDWGELHPKLRERYGVEASDGRWALADGEMARVASHPLALPALWLGTVDDFLFPEGGTDVPFSMTNEAFVDDAGYEAVFLERRFETDPPRRLVDTLRWNPERGCVTDFYGRRGRVVADLHLETDDGIVLLDVGRQWLRVGGRYLPLPGPLSVDGEIRDGYDDDAGVYDVSIEIRGPLVGRIFACEGQFGNAFREVGSGAPTQTALGGVDLPGART